MIRLRQVALVAHDLDKATDEVRRNLEVDVCFRDPGVAEFGLHNALFRIGDQFLEIVSPTREGTTAGRLLHRMGGDCGYMAIFDVDDLDSRMQRLASLGVRTVWQGNFPQIRGRHLHPKDTGGTLVSIDQPTRPGDWHWGGPTWRQRNASMLATAITGITLSSDDPTGLAHRWHELHIDESVAFENRHQRGDCLAAVQLNARQPNSTPRTFRICNVDFSVR
jgi:hypothetical protein